MCVSAFIRENSPGAKPIVSWKMKKVPKFLASETTVGKDWIVQELKFRTFNKKLKQFVAEHVKGVKKWEKMHVPQVGYVYYFKDGKGNNVAMWEEKEKTLRIRKGYDI